MKITHVETLVSAGKFAESQAWTELRDSLHRAIANVSWPVGSGSFTVYPEHHGSGVKPIKLDLLIDLKEHDWAKETSWPVSVSAFRPGDIDFALTTESGLVVLEWETGNVSSSHRSVNKLAMALLQEVIVAGCLVVPSRKLAWFLTDRIGNYEEIVPYFPLWKSVPVKEGVLEIIVVEHDAESTDVPKIPKGTDGRALR